MAAMQRRLDDCEAAALATEKLMDATRRRLDEYEAALREEQARSTLAEQDAAVLREERDGLRVSSAHLAEEAARLRAHAEFLSSHSREYCNSSKFLLFVLGDDTVMC